MIAGESDWTLRRLRRKLSSVEVLNLNSVIRVLVKKGKGANRLHVNNIRRFAQKLKWDAKTT